MAFSTNGYRRRRVCVGSGLRGALRNVMNHGQLQYSYPLSFRELRHQHIASIWKFNRIMVAVRNIRIYHAEFSHPEIGCSLADPSVVVFDVFGERQFGPRKHADRYGRLTF
jgi:hypothetical protein